MLDTDIQINNNNLPILQSVLRDDQLWIQTLIFFQTLRDRCYLYGKDNLKFIEVTIREDIYC
ncbi:hypothetical protein BpHYR1_000706 [Brachionus plicatilis]|uniref:Uncharacterized protein n=1 Tax=Brachionus plicatilis TaxID=10195 RepID=A0A3M7T5P8_BRAPC|nr:hypothetical protein BpHYR1_000706 [Brachionus plicatilis]